tara:strand:- start:1582 stop:2388 length:807 start_codon:yes stop_codon:yes gene_type:complete
MAYKCLECGEVVKTPSVKFVVKKCSCNSLEISKSYSGELIFSNDNYEFKKDKSDYVIKPIDKKIAKELIIENHYSHAWTSCRYALGLFYDDNIVGVAVYGFPVGRQVVKSISPILENGNVLELTRLWVAESEGKNTESFFLGKTFSWLKENDKDIWILISYSDPMVDHVGIIYQATNWLYQGNNVKKGKSWMYKINNQWYHPRTVISNWGSTKDAIIAEVDENFEKVVMPKKHRYLYVLNKRERKNILKSLKHPIVPYVKDNSTCNWD